MMAPCFRFFAGKGGVGKTTCAAASAVAAAARGEEVLVVSTDPAHSLGDALGTKLGPRPRRIATRRGVLHAVELDAEAALRRWLAEREEDFRTLALRGTVLDEDDVDRLLGTALPGVDELVGLVELVRLSRGRPRAAVVVDAAPTGHLLRLLETPGLLRRFAEVLDDMQAKHRYLAARLGGRRGDPLDAVIDAVDEEGELLADLLRDPARTRVTWVTLPETLAALETADGLAALARLGLTVDAVWCNRVTPAPRSTCRDCGARRSAEAEALRALERLAPRILAGVPVMPAEPRGTAALGRLARAVGPIAPARARAQPRPKPARGAARPARAVLEVLVPPRARITLFLGKGGVGKTSCAAAAALAAARRSTGERILLLSTDPAHSLGDALRAHLDDRERPVPGSPGGLVAREIDAPRALAAARARNREAVQRVFEAAVGGTHVDASFDRKVVLDLLDLSPPGLDELIAIAAVLRAVFGTGGRRRAWDRVVVDTAPTGHALRMLALPETALEWVHALLEILLKYRRVLGLGDFARDLLDLARDLKALSALLRDPERARLVVVTRAAELPARESERLVAALRRDGMTVSALVVNDVHDPSPPSCGACRRRAAAEARQIARLGRLGCAMLRAPAWPDPPVGAAALEAWAQAIETVTA